MNDSFGARTTLQVGSESHNVASLEALAKAGHDLARLPYSIRILLENLLRHEDGTTVTKEDIQSILDWDPAATPSTEIAFTPGRVLLQDFTGVPAVVDLAAMRDAMGELGGDPTAINPGQPVELVIDHSVQVDNFGSGRCPRVSTTRSSSSVIANAICFLRWGQQRVREFPGCAAEYRHRASGQPGVPERAWSCDVERNEDGSPSLIRSLGTDSHTTMINGAGRPWLGCWRYRGRGRHAGSAVVTMLMPHVVGFELDRQAARRAGCDGNRPRAARRRDAAYEDGVVGKFVEFFGSGLDHLPASRTARRSRTWRPSTARPAASSRSTPLTLEYLRSHGPLRRRQSCARRGLRCKEQGLWRTDDARGDVHDVLNSDLATVEPSLAGPKRPQDRISLSDMKSAFNEALRAW